MEKIKLVIWDMDNTFWKGTLAEGDIEIRQKKFKHSPAINGSWYHQLNLFKK